jgi:dihydrofolate reductase
MKLVVAVDNNWGIGYKGELLARVRADLRYFQSLTKGNTVILGSKTLSTFPGGRVLKDRVNIVLSRRPDYKPEGATVVGSIDELLSYVKDLDSENIFVIGGATVYEQLLPYCDTAYVTKFNKIFESDARFANLDESPEWELAEVGGEQTTNPETDTEPDMTFNFCIYKRKNAPVIIRESKPEDSEAVYGLLRIIADVHKNGRPDMFSDLISKYTPEEVLERLSKNDNGVFVAEYTDKTVGYIFCDVIKEGSGLTLYIDDLCVDPNARRLGIGKLLINKAAEYAKEKNCSMLMLNVWEFNGGAVEFYEKLGFKTRTRHMELKL